MYENLSLIYDSYMQDVDYYNWAEYLSSLIKEKNHNTKTVLEYGCGSGNLTLPLSNNFNVIGVDLSEEMLSIAEYKLRDSGVQLYKGDLRSFEYNNQVDSIILACDTLTMFDYKDIEKFFIQAFKQLKPGGILLFDILSEDYLKNYIAANNFIFEDENVYFTWTSECFSNFIDSNFTFFVKEKDYYRRIDDYQRQYILDINKLEELLEKTGFKDIESYDFPTRNTVSYRTDRIQFIAEKPKLLSEA